MDFNELFALIKPNLILELKSLLDRRTTHRGLLDVQKKRIKQVLKSKVKVRIGRPRKTKLRG